MKVEAARIHYMRAVMGNNECTLLGLQQSINVLNELRSRHSYLFRKNLNDKVTLTRWPDTRCPCVHLIKMVLGHLWPCLVILQK